jgi:hypothetical protein
MEVATGEKCKKINKIFLFKGVLLLKIGLLLQDFRDN